MRGGLAWVRETLSRGSPRVGTQASRPRLARPPRPRWVKGASGGRGARPPRPAPPSLPRVQGAPGGGGRSPPPRRVELAARLPRPLRVQEASGSPISHELRSPSCRPCVCCKAVASSRGGSPLGDRQALEGWARMGSRVTLSRGSPRVETQASRPRLAWPRALWRHASGCGGGAASSAASCGSRHPFGAPFPPELPLARLFSLPLAATGAFGFGANG